MVYRRFPLLSILSGCTFAPFILNGAPTSAVWQNFLDAQSNHTEPTLPDFSYAGYHRSEVNLPSVSGPVFNVTDYGAIPDDYRSDRDAIQAAILAAEAANGGVVFFPPGRFHLNTISEPGSPIRIRKSNIVLRGSGAWSGGTELYMESKLDPIDPNAMYSTPEYFLIQPNSTSSSTLSSITANAERETFSIEVANGAAFQANQWVNLYLLSTDAVADALAPQSVNAEWSRLAQEGLPVNEKHQIASTNGNTLTFHEPLHTEINANHNWSVKSYSNIEEVGIEDITFRGNWLGNFVHHRSAEDDSAWGAFAINNVVNSWIQRCRFINWNVVANFDKTSYFTVLHTRIEGNPGHFGFHTRRGYGNLFAFSSDLASQWHGPSVGYQNSGAVFYNFDYPASASFDAHGDAPYATLLDSVEGGFLRGRTGGPLEGQPNHLRWFTLWNFKHLGSPLVNHDFWFDNANTRDRFLEPIIVGFHGTNSTFAPDSVQVIESLGAPVDPESLFEAQLSLRLGSLPAFFASWKNTWSQWSSMPAESVVHLQSADDLNDALKTATPGTRLVLANGIYRNQSFKLDGKTTANGLGGTADLPITLCAETPGKVAIIGESNLRFGGQYMTVDGLLFTEGSAKSGPVIMFETSSSNTAKECLLSNTAIVNFNPSDPSSDYDWIDISGSKNRIENCAFTGMNHKGVQLVIRLSSGNTATYEHTLSGNYFADRASGSGNGYETIRIGTSDNSLIAANTSVTRNLFERCDGEIETISNKSVGNLYQGNTFRQNNGQLTLRHGAACTVDSNFFLGEFKSGTGGVRIVGPDHIIINNYFYQLRGNSNLRAAITLMNGVPNSPLNRYEPTTRAIIAHNTIIDCDAPVNIGTVSSEGDTTVPPADSTFLNNLISSTQTHFSFYNTPTNFNYLGQVSFRGSSGLPGSAQVSSSDPLLVADSFGIFRPSASSPLIDAANTSTSIIVNHDIDGASRLGGTPDIGADEFSTAGFQARPLNPENVGPSWPIEIPNIPKPGEGTFTESFTYSDGLLRGNGFWVDSGTTASRESENTDAITIAFETVKMILDGEFNSTGTLFTQTTNDEGFANGTLYASMHLTVGSVPESNPQPDYFGAFSTLDGNTLRGRIWITDQDPTTNTFRLGVTSKTGSPFAVVKSRPLDVGITYSLILKHAFDTSSTDTHLYIDASAESDPSIRETASSGSTIGGFSLRSNASPTGVLWIDNLIVGNQFEEVFNTIWDPFGGYRYPDTRWFRHPNLGLYFRRASGHTYHSKMGWLWMLPPGTPDSSIYFYDYHTQAWALTHPSYFPWFYSYDNNAPGWYLLDNSSTPTNRIVSK